MEPINVHDYERLARERLSPGAWAYYSSGADLLWKRGSYRSRPCW